MAASQFVVPAPEHLVYRDTPAISPDGRTIAFVAAGADGRSQLWVRPLDVLTARALTGTDGAVAPFWSPDSRSIGFFAQGQLKRTDASGGAPQILASVGGGNLNRAGSWNRDGIILFSEGWANRLNKVPAVGGAVASVTTGSYPLLSSGRSTLPFLSGPSGSRLLTPTRLARASTLAPSIRPRRSCSRWPIPPASMRRRVFCYSVEAEH